MQKRLVGTLVAIGLITTGCVTINIYFPAAAAEKAADKIIDEVWQLKPDAKSVKPANPAADNKGEAK
jgi:hypothetical protein